MVSGSVLNALYDDPVSAAHEQTRRLREIFRAFVLKFQCAVFCRTTPKQKARMVKLVRGEDFITMAVGDGANDVNMIQEAHVGVGIVGNEGKQAANCSDFAMHKFKDLKRYALTRLLLFHGRLTYSKMSFMIVFYFYKNILFTMGQFYFAFANRFSRQSLYRDWLISFFNMVFTTYGLAAFALFEQDIQSRESERLLPETFLYFSGQKNLGFDRYVFLGWFGSGMLESLFIFVFVRVLDTQSNTFSQFRESHFELVSMIVYTVIIVHIQVKLFMYTNHLVCLLVLTFLLTSFGFYAAYVLFFDRYMALSYFRTLRIIWTNPSFYLVVGFLLGTLFLVSFTKQQVRYSPRSRR